MENKITIEDEVLVADVPGYEGLYQVTSDGQIRGVKQGKYLRPQDNGTGYKFVFLSKDGEKHRMYIHRIVAEAFCPRTNDAFTEIHHIDGNRNNNAAYNLEWTDKSDHRRLHKQKEVEQLDPTTEEVVNTYCSGIEAARALGGYACYISKCCNGKQKTAYGYGWRFKDTDGGNK